MNHRPGPGYIEEATINLNNLSTHFINNLTWVIQESQDIAYNILKLYELNRKVDGSAYYCLIAAYSLLILLGSCGNILVVCVVIRKPAMRTARNMFILNLAISDLLLCLVTMPLTLMEILTRYWPLGHNSFICKMIGTSPSDKHIRIDVIDNSNRFGQVSSDRLSDPGFFT